MSGFHGIFKIRFIILRAGHHTHTALCQKGIASGRITLGNDGNGFILWKM